MKAIFEKLYQEVSEEFAKANIEDGERANLSKSDLRGANLSKSDLSGANLSWANLSEANLRWAKGVWSMQFDTRGYRLIMWVCPVANQPLFQAGCHTEGWTLEQAAAHWSSGDYEDKERGAEYVYWCKALANAPDVKRQIEAVQQNEEN